MLRALICGVIVCVAAFFSGCAATKTENMDYYEAEARLLQRLGLKRDLLTNDSRWVKTRAADPIADHLVLPVFDVEVVSLRPGEALCLRTRHLYDIGAVGGERVRFSIQQMKAETVEVQVDYSNKWRGCFPPFFFWNPGCFREREMIEDIWGDGKPVPNSVTGEVD